MVRFLPESIVVAIHDDLIRLYGGSYGVLNAGALDAALHMPPAQYGGEFLHPTIFHMAAAYGFHLSQNHPFVDGNKRVAGMGMLTFLKMNGLETVATEIEYYEVMMSVASGHMGKQPLVEWLQTMTTGVAPDIT